jgi:hypothetical protein
MKNKKNVKSKIQGMAIIVVSYLLTGTLLGVIALFVSKTAFGLCVSGLGSGLMIATLAELVNADFANFKAEAKIALLGIPPVCMCFLIRGPFFWFLLGHSAMIFLRAATQIGMNIYKEAPDVV